MPSPEGGFAGSLVPKWAAFHWAEFKNRASAVTTAADAAASPPPPTCFPSTPNRREPSYN